MDVVGFLEFLTRDIGELGFSNKRLGLGANELLLKLDDLGARWFFVLELLDFVGDLAG